MAKGIVGGLQRLVDAVWYSAQGRRTPARRSFAAGRTDRLFADWIGSVGPIDNYIRRDLVTMRSGSRRLAMDNDYMKAFLRMVRRHIVGPEGIRLQNRAVDTNGKEDKQANDLIEAAWREWGSRGSCTSCGRLSWRDVERLVATTVARDGEVLVRLLRGFPNRFGFALQIIPADYLDETLHRDLAGGSRIRMGIETDRWKRPVAYHVKMTAADGRTSRHERIAAADCLHIFIPEDADQSRGVPWAHTAIRRLGMAGGYEEAALVAARAGAAKMGFFQQTEEGKKFGPGEETSKGDFISDAEPGHMEVLPFGYEFKEFDPGYPNGEMSVFMKSVLRGAASGVGVSYNGMANDLEGVNYSSLRAGALEERDEWMVLQGWLIDSLQGPVYRAWLEQSMISGAVALPFAKFAKFHAPHWFPRRWKWVDPDKEGRANSRDIGLGLTSRTRLAAEQGRDIETIFEELRREQDLAREMGVHLGDPEKMSINPQSETETDAEE